MPVPTFTGLPPYPEFSDVTAKINKLVQELQNLMLSLDTLNIAELDAEVIIANTITADKMNVSELSAITANLGTITAGLMIAVNIIGSYIATANGAYPRCEMSSTDNLFAAYKDANNYISMVPVFSGGPPAFGAVVNGHDAYTLTASSTDVVLNVGGRKLVLTTNVQGDIELFPELGYFVRVPSWNALMNNGTGVDLASELAGKATAGGNTGSGGAVTLNGGIPIDTVLATAGGGSVTWKGINVPNHTHIQT